MNSQNNQIKSIWHNNIHIGFIARRSSVIGCAQEIPDGWMINTDKRNWSGNFKTRKLAREALI